MGFISTTKPDTLCVHCVLFCNHRLFSCYHLPLIMQTLSFYLSIEGNDVLPYLNLGSSLFFICISY